MELAQDKRGELKEMKYLTPTRSALIYEMPLAEVITDFFDELKSRSKGYASMEYSLIGYRENDLVRLDIKINEEEATPLACIVHREKSYQMGKALTEKLKELIPRQLFKVRPSARACAIQLSLVDACVHRLTLPPRGVFKSSFPPYSFPCTRKTQVPIQACIGGKVIASSQISAMRKDVLAKWCVPHAAYSY